MPMSKNAINSPRITCLVTTLVLLLLPFIAMAEAEVSIADNTAATLKSFIELKGNLRRDIKALNKRLQAAQSDAEKRGVKTATGAA